MAPRAGGRGGGGDGRDDLRPLAASGDDMEAALLDPGNGDGGEPFYLSDGDSETELFLPLDDMISSAGVPRGDSSGSGDAAGGPLTRWQALRTVALALVYISAWYGLSTCLSLFNKWFLGKA